MCCICQNKEEYNRWIIETLQYVLGILISHSGKGDPLNLHFGINTISIDTNAGEYN